MKSASLSQTIDVDTPELVVLSYTIAGVGSRASAALIDYLICFFILIVLTVGAGYIGLHFGAGTHIFATLRAQGTARADPIAS